MPRFSSVVLILCPVCLGSGRNPEAPAAIADDEGTCMLFPPAPLVCGLPRSGAGRTHVHGVAGVKLVAVVHAAPQRASERVGQPDLRDSRIGASLKAPRSRRDCCADHLEVGGVRSARRVHIA